MRVNKMKIYVGFAVFVYYSFIYIFTELILIWLKAAHFLPIPHAFLQHDHAKQQSIEK